MRDKLIELMSNVTSCDSLGVDDCRKCKYREELDCKRARTADHLIANGVTFAEDNNVPCKKPMTNGDRIRSMSDEGLAEFNSFCPFIDEECTRKGCIACVLEWLKQPVEE